MKRFIYGLISILLCLSMIVVVPAAGISMAAAASPDEMSPRAQDIFDRFVNFMIDVIHRAITAFRYPWKSKTGNTVDMSKFTLTFEDNFDGDALSLVWGNYADGVRKGGYWDETQSFVRDGNLIIRAEYKEDGRFGPGYYSRRVDTRSGFQQTFGYFECRCILPAAQGLWSAFWLSSTNIKDYLPGDQGTEIDVFESPLWYRGKLGLKNNLVTSNLHYGGYSLGHRYRNVAVAEANNPYEEYNTYGLEWNEKEYIFYVNGVETGRSSFGGVSKVPEFMELSIEVDGGSGKPHHGWSGVITDNEPGALPADLVVDYVRAYQYTELMK